MQLKPALHAVLEGSFKISMHDPMRLKASVRVHEKVYQAILNHQPEAARLSMLELLGVARATSSILIGKAHNPSITELDAHLIYTGFSLRLCFYAWFLLYRQRRHELR